MKVNFVNITAEPEYTMSYIARVSNPNNQQNSQVATVELGSGLQSITLFALVRPFCRSPIFIVAFLKDGTSSKPEEEFPTTTST